MSTDFASLSEELFAEDWESEEDKVYDKPSPAAQCSLGHGCLARAF